MTDTVSVTENVWVRAFSH